MKKSTVSGPARKDGPKASRRDGGGSRIKSKMASEKLLQEWARKEEMEKSVQPTLFRRTVSLMEPPKQKSCLEYLMDTVCLSCGDVEDNYEVDRVSY